MSRPIPSLREQLLCVTVGGPAVISADHYSLLMSIINKLEILEEAVEPTRFLNSDELCTYQRREIKRLQRQAIELVETAEESHAKLTETEAERERLREQLKRVTRDGLELVQKVREERDEVLRSIQTTKEEE